MKTGIRSVFIPDSVKIIGNGAFSDCTDLEEVKFSEGLIEIEDWCFANCSLIKEINLPDTVEEIGEMAFRGCSSLCKVRLPNGLREIKVMTFKECGSLIEVMISISTRVNSNAFGDNHRRSVIKYYGNNFSTYSVRIQPQEVKPQINCTTTSYSIGTVNKSLDERQCYNETGKILYVSSMDFILEHEDIQKQMDRQYKWKNIVKIVLQEGITEVKPEAFSKLKNLEEVNLPSSLQKIGYAAFQSCPKLKSVVMEEGIKTISARAFQGCKSLSKVSIPLSVKYIGDCAFLDCRLDKTVVQSECVICDGNQGIGIA